LVYDVDGRHSQREAPAPSLFPVALKNTYIFVNFITDVFPWQWWPCSLSEEVATAQLSLNPRILATLLRKTFDIHF